MVKGTILLTILVLSIPLIYLIYLNTNLLISFERHFRNMVCIVISHLVNSCRRNREARSFIYFKVLSCRKSQAYIMLSSSSPIIYHQNMCRLYMTVNGTLPYSSSGLILRNGNAYEVHSRRSTTSGMDIRRCINVKVIKCYREMN